MYTAFGKSRVVIYARVSTEHEAQLSALENQIDWYKPILEARPEWVLAGHYIDEGITGTSAEKRPQFMRMIEDAKHKKFDMIITREVSRFARNTVDTLQYTRMLKEHGVAVFFLNDNINTFDGDGELRLTIMATLAQDESRKTSIRVKSGQQTSMDNGVIYGNGNILGYTRYEWKEGDKKHVEMRINPEQAKTVRTIFDMYLAGEGLIAIKYELEKLGYKTSTGKSNGHGTVISHILKNTFYCGIMTYHKEYTPDYLKQKKVKNYGEMEYTRVQGTHEPIVTVEEFERVQKIMASRQMSYPTENNTAAKKGKKNRTTVWGKLLVCSCGHNFNMRFWNKKDRQVQHSFQCYGSLRTGSYQTRLNKGLSVEGICRTPMIPEWRLQMMANLIFRNYLNNKAKVLALANSMLEAHIDDPEEEDNTQELMEAKQQELAHLEKKLDGYIEMRSEGEMSKEMFTRKASEVDARIKQLQDELSKLEHRAKPKPVTNYREKLTVLQYALEQYTHVDEGKDVPESVIEAFVERIVASPDGFEWFLRFEGEPDKPLFCQIEGKRKKSAKVMIAGEISPSEDCSGAGCYRQQVSCQKFASFVVAADDAPSISAPGPLNAVY